VHYLHEVTALAYTTADDIHVGAPFAPGRFRCIVAYSECSPPLCRSSLPAEAGQMVRTDLERLTRRSPVHHYCLSRRDGSRPCVVANLDGIPSRRQGDGLVDLFGRKLRARTVEHSVVIRAGGLHGQRS
jgi:hypothetical protein